MCGARVRALLQRFARFSFGLDCLKLARGSISTAALRATREPRQRENQRPPGSSHFLHRRISTAVRMWCDRQPRLMLLMLLLELAGVDALGEESYRLPAERARPDHTQFIPYFAQTLSVVEAENFTSTSPAGESSWQAREWARSPNYFASVVSNVFHSRRAYLHAPANASAAATAVATLSIERAGNYTPLVRFEAPFGYAVPFTLELLDSTERRLLKHTFGLRTSPKVWGFGKARSGGHTAYDTRAGVAPGCASGLVAECKWPWGAT